MSSPFTPKRVVVPGVLDSAAYDEKLKQYSDTARPAAEPLSSGALGFADKIAADGARVMRQGANKAKSAASQQKKAQSQLDAQTPETGFGMLNSQERQQVSEDRATDAVEREKSVTSRVETRRRMRDLTDEEAADLGMPSAPSDAGVNDEQASLDQQRLTASRERTDKAISAITNRDEQPTQKWWLNTSQVAARSAAQMGLDAAKFPFILYEGASSTPFAETSAGREWLQAREKELHEILPGDKARSEDFLTKLSAGGGSFAGFMIAGYMTGGSGAMALGAASQGSSMFEEAEEFDAPSTQKYIALISGTALGATEAIPIDRMFMRMDVATGGGVKRALRNTAAGSLEEFTQELGQSLGQDVVAKYVAGYDPDRELDAVTYLENGVIGAIVGGAANLATTTYSEVRGGNPPEPAPEQVDLQFTEAQQAMADAQSQFDERFNDNPDSMVDSTGSPDVRPTIIPNDSEAIQAQLGLLGVELDPEALSRVSQDDVNTALASVAADADTALEGLSPEQQQQVLTQLNEAATLLDSEVAPSPLAGLETREDGMVELVHWSHQPRDTIDPLAMGSGPLRGQERSRLVGPDAVPRSYFGVDPIVDFKPTKNKPYTTANDGYRKEGGVGNVRHVVAVDPETLYPWWEDPEGLKEGLNRELAVSEQVTQYEKIIADAGYAGAYFSSSPNGRTVAMFEAVEPETVVNDADGQVLRGPANAKGASKKALKVSGNADYQPLPGLPKSQVGPVNRVVDAARAYASQAGLPVRRQAEYVTVDVERATRIAQAYEDMPNTPNDPATLVSYTALAEETLAQYQFVKASGLQVEFIEEGQSDPYPDGPKQVLDDLKQGHLWVFPTEGGFGTVNEADAAHPLLEKTGEVVGDRELVYNDVFRIVHDFFGHGIEGSGFGPRGEENAWQSHARMYSEAALPAMTSETRGQNSWVNYGPYGEQNRSNQKETVYADQKIGLMPEWTWQEGLDDDVDYDDYEANIAMDVSGMQDEVSRISARFPTQQQSTEDPMTSTLSIGLPAMQASKRAFDHNMKVVRGYPNMRQTGKRETAEATAERFVDHVADNLEWVYNQVPEEVRNQTRGWYDGARKIARDWGQRYELPDRAVAGVMAAMSPQKDWYSNVSLTERVLDIVAFRGDIDWDPAMEEVAEKFFPAGPLHDLVQRINGRSLEALAAQGESQALQALWVRIYDHAHHSSGVRAVAADGAFLDQSASSVNWGSLVEIGKALRIVADPSQENINAIMGDRHKIRSFYNNIISPGSDADVTIDTHAVAAGLLRPLGGNTPEVVHNFGNGLPKAKQPKGWQPAKSVGVSGAKGTYGLYAEAYRKAAERVGVLPREMQSITWEAIRGLYPAKFKANPEQVDKIEKLWSKYRKGTADLAQTRQEIINVTGGFTNPDWYSGSGIARRAIEGRGVSRDGGVITSSYARDISDASVPVWSSRRVDDGAGGATSEAVPEELEAQTARGRSRLTQERDRPTTGVKDDGRVTDPEETSLNRIADNFTQLMDIVVRQGRLTIKGGAVGQYNRKTGITRIKSHGDLSTIVHEAGHALNDRMAGPLEKFVDQNEVAVISVGKELYGGDLSTAKKEKQRREGFAEFFRVYVLSRPFADKQYPELTAKFDALLQKTDADLRDGLDMIRQQYDAYLSMPSAKVMQGMLVKHSTNSGLKGALTEMKEHGVRTWFSEKVNRVLTEGVNQYAPLNKLVADTLNIAESELGAPLDLTASNDPRVLARMARNSGSRAMVAITDGVTAYRSMTSTTKGLREAFLLSQGATADAQLGAIDETREVDFDTYLVALRSLAEYKRYAEGAINRPPVNASIGDVRQTIAEMDAKYGPNFRDAATIVDSYGRALWRKQYDAGLLDKETFTNGLDKDFYAPLQRDMSDKQSALGSSILSADSGAKKAGKRFKGSDRQVVSPMQVLMHMTFSVEAAIAENDVKKALGALADKTPNAGALVERVPAHKLVGSSFSIQEAAKRITKDGDLSDTDAADLMAIVKTNIDTDKFMSMFHSEQASAAGENIMFYWDNGKVQAIQVADDVGADVVEVLSGVGRENMPMLTEMVAMTSTAFRSAITSWPDFLLVNFIRDQMSAWILTDVGYTPFVTGAKGVYEEVRQKGVARDYNVAMGTMGGMNVAALHDARVDRDLNALRKDGYVAKLFGGKGFLGAARGLAKVTELTETGTRLGIYEKAFARAKADGLNDYDAAIESGYTATDYIDFGLHGNRTMLLRRVIPFLSAQVNGLYKMVRVLGADEVAQRKGLKFALQSFFKNVNGLELSRREKQAVVTGRKAWLKMTALSMFGAALTAMYHDDEDYQETSEYLRTTGWVIPTGDGQIAYIPKPFELAMVNNIVERSMEAAYGDKAAKGRLLRGMALSLSPPTAPPALQALIEHKANYSFFAQRNIVPDYMLRLDPQLQYNNYTSEFAKTVGSLTGSSPMVVDHYMNSLGASAYRDVSSMLNTLSPHSKSMGVSDAPITRRFIRDSRRGAASASDFWDMASTADGSLTQAYTTYKTFVDQGRGNAAERFLQEQDADHQAFAVMNTHFTAAEKRLHPMYRARQVAGVLSGMRREISSELGLERTQKYNEGEIPLTKGAKRRVDTLLSELSRREVRNALVLNGVDGWGDKEPLDVMTTIALIEQEAPDVAEELHTRIKKAKVYPAEFVQENWNDARERILLDRENAVLSDLAGIGKTLASIGAYQQ